MKEERTGGRKGDSVKDVTDQGETVTNQGETAGKNNYSLPTLK